MLVLKFGGTSVGTVGQLCRVREIVGQAARSQRVVVVVSAFSGVTNQLLKAIEERLDPKTPPDEGLIGQLRERHLDALGQLCRGRLDPGTEDLLDRRLARLSDLLDGVALIGDCSAKTRDQILASGERLCVPVVVAGLREMGHDAKGFDGSQVIATDSTFGEAAVDLAQTRLRAHRQLMQLPASTIPIITGFIGGDEDGRTTTLGRGGSDYSATILGNTLDANRVEIWTDVDGALSAEPRWVKEAGLIPALSYREASEMAFFGAKVMHPRMVQSLAAKGIAIAIRNTALPEEPGTEIMEKPPRIRRAVKAVTAVDDLTLLTLTHSEQMGIQSVSSRLHTVLERLGTQIFLFSQTSPGPRTAFVVRTEESAAVVRAVQTEFRLEIGNRLMPDVVRRQGVGVVAAVGDGIREQPSIAGQLLCALDRNRVPILAFSDGTAHGCLSVVVDSRDLQRAVTDLHSCLVMRRRRLNLVLIGATGKVGQAFLQQLQRKQPDLLRELNLELRLVAAADSRRAVWQGEGIDLGSVPEALASTKDTRASLFPRLLNLPFEHLMVVDCTANQTVAGAYEALLGSGIAVVTSNKLANTGSLATYQRLQGLSSRRGVPYRYETTVGAPLPAIRTLGELRRSGDILRRLEGILSGTLSFLFHQMHAGEKFSRAVRAAILRGFTEGDPRVDLTGEDTARKLLILAREGGHKLTREAVQVESLLPLPLDGSTSQKALVHSLEEHDPTWEKRIADAVARGKRLVYLARFHALDQGPTQELIAATRSESGTQNGWLARVGVEEIAADHPMFNLEGGANRILYQTDRYQRIPLSLSGPGAGPESAAAGLLADVVEASRELTGGLLEPPQRILLPREEDWRVSA